MSTIIEPSEEAKTSSHRCRQMSLSLGVFVKARQTDAMIAGGFSILDGAVRAGSVFAMRQVVGAKRVVERAGIAEASGSHAEADVLRKEARCNAYRKRRHVRIHCRAILSCTLDVRRIVKETLPIKSDSPEFKLTIATHARSPRPDNVGTPGGISHFPAVERVYGDASINYGDEIRVGQRIEHGSWPGAINAAEDQIVVECQAKSCCFANGPVGDHNVAQVRSFCCCSLPACDVKFGPLKVRVSGCRTNEPVEVVRFHHIKVHYGQLAQSGRGEAHKNIEPDAAGSHHKDSPSDQIGLALRTPRANGSGLKATWHWRWLDCVIPGHGEFVADNPDVRTMSTVDPVAESDIPVAS